MPHVRPALAALLVGPVLLYLALDSGGFFPGAWTIAAAALAWGAAMGVVFLGARGLGGLRLAWPALLAAFVAWTALSALWSVDAGRTWDEARRALVYAAGAAALVVLARRGARAPLVVGTWATLTGVVTYAVLRYLLESGYRDPAQGDLLSRPVGYANALAILAGAAAVAAVGIALAPPRPWLRFASLASLVPLAVAIHLAESRATVLAVAVGLAVVIAFAPVPRAALVVAAVATAVVVAVAWGGGLFTSGYRPSYWHVAWHEYVRHPLLGSGAGTFGRFWAREGDPGLAGGALDAHSLYLETLAELGPVGLALLLAALALPLRRVRREPLALAAAGAYVAILAHAALDWDWEMPVVILAALAFAGALLADG